MKMKFVSLSLCMALLSSFTVSASAYDVNDIYTQVTAIRNELGYPQGNWSSLRRAVNYIADHLPSSPMDYSTVLSNIKSNSDSLVSTVDAIKGDTNNISHRSTDILNKLADINTNIGTAQIAITNHIDSASSLNHEDLSVISGDLYDFLSLFKDKQTFGYSQGEDKPIVTVRTTIPQLWADIAFSLTRDGEVPAFGNRTFYSRFKQLQEVLASDDDLKLKQDNKANEDAATDAFVNGNSSKTSLGAGDIGNLKDVGGTFNDLTSLNGQSSVSSFLSGLTSADGTGQGWFSEATRASLDAVSTPVTTTKLVQKTWRGEKALFASVSYDSVNSVASPASVLDADPYNMSGFENNYNWLWGDAS